MRLFRAFSSLTAEIDATIHARLRADDAKAYWAYWISDKVVRLGLFGGVVALVTYVVLAKIASMNGADDQIVLQLGKGAAPWLVGTLGVSAVAGIFRAPLQRKLREHIRTIWNRGAGH